MCSSELYICIYLTKFIHHTSVYFIYLVSVPVVWVYYSEFISRLYMYCEGQVIFTSYSVSFNIRSL